MRWEVVELITEHRPSAFYSIIMSASACSPHPLPLWVCNSSLIFQTVPWTALIAVATKRYLLSLLSSQPGGAWERGWKGKEPGVKPQVMQNWLKGYLACTYGMLLEPSAW